MSRVVLHIGRVIVEGDALSLRDAEALRSDLGRELATALQQQLLGATRRGRHSVTASFGCDRIAVGDALVGGGGGAAGRAAARSLATALAPLLTTASSRQRRDGHG
jgi:hypothetical protein